MTERFADELEALRNRLGELIERSDFGDPSRTVASEALEELSVAIEEFQSQNSELIEGQADLDRERRRYRDLFEEVPDAYLVTNAEGIIVEANTTAFQLFGRGRSSLLGRPLARHIVSGDQRAFYTLLGRLGRMAEGGTTSIDLLVQDHRVVPANLRATTGSGPDNQHTIRWLVHDRGRELASDDLRVSENRLRALFDTADVGIVLCDTDRNIVFINPCAVDLLGFDADATVPVDWLRHVPSDERELIDASITRAIDGVGETSRRHRIEIDTQKGAGAAEVAPPAVRWIEHGIIPFQSDDEQRRGFLSTLTDVTAEHEAMSDLARSRDFIAAILDTAGAIIVVVDIDGRIQLFNGTAERVSGWTAEEAIGQSVFELLLAPEDRGAAAQVISDTANGALTNWENDWLTKNGRRRQISWTNTAMTSPDGIVDAIVGTGIDVTEQRQLERQVAQTERLHSIGRLAAGVAHDFNNTLAVLLARVDRIDRRSNDPAMATDIDGLRRTIEHSKSMISDLLTFSGRQPPATVSIKVDEELERIVEMLADLLGPDITIDLHLGVGEAMALIDPGRFDQVITNLAINARDAMPDGGTITLSTEPETIADDNGMTTPAKAVLAPGNYIRVTMTDSGAGIAPAILDRIFEPYFTTKERGKGTGIGLAMLYGIVKQAGGEVVVESEAGQWTRFTLWIRRAARQSLPAAHDAKSHRPQSPDAAPIESQRGTTDQPTTTAPRAAHSTEPRATADQTDAGNGQSVTVLIVEDDHEIRQLLIDELTDAGYRILETDRGTMAITMVDEPIDLLISDVDLPGVDGITVANRFLDRSPNMPVLLISGVATPETLQRIPASASFLAKPFGRSSFLATIEELLIGGNAAR